MIVLARFAEPDPGRSDVTSADEAFVADASELLSLLAERPGFLGGRLVRSTDVGGGWVLVLEWETVGDWRRAFSPFEVRTRAMTFFAAAEDAPNAYEVLAEVTPGGAVVLGSSDREGGSRDLRAPGS